MKRASTALGVIAAVLMAICVYVHFSKDRQGPEIKFPKSKLTYTDKTDTQQLLKGVTAVDNKDGDVSSTLRISFVIPNEEHKEVIVEYLAKDKSNNITKSAQTYHYSGHKSLAVLNDPTASESQNSAGKSGAK